MNNNNKSNLIIAIDLELEQPFTNPQTPDSKIDYSKILSLGVCVGDLSGEIIYTENIFFEYKYTISKFIKQLTGIKESDVIDGMSSRDAFSRLNTIRDVYQASRILLEWGSGDYTKLLEEANINKEDSPFGLSGLNVKHLFRSLSMANNLDSSGGLRTSIKKFNKLFPEYSFKFEGSAHNSEVDAVNTYMFYVKMLQVLKKK